MNEKLQLWWDDDFQFYDLRVLDVKATISDLESVFDSVFCGEDVNLKYSESCQGCCICCGGRIPLTPGDLVRLQDSVSFELDKWWIEITDLGLCFDFTLVCHDDICVFWDREKLICSCYQFRPFVCRSYICAPLSYPLAKLRSQIINYGEDLLTEMYKKQESLGDYDFQKTVIKDICSPDLWQVLFTV